MKNYYNILGLSEGASEKEIKNAYRKLSKEHHPDMTGGDDTKFKEISEAYAILTGKEKPKQEEHYGGFRTRRPKPQIRQIEVLISVSEAYSGGKKKIKYKVYDKCGTCDGVGGKSRKICHTCVGSGFIRQSMFAFSCHVCNGRGYLFEEGCNTCNTSGRIITEKIIEVDIPKYCTDRLAIIARGYGDYVPNMDIGDVVFIFVVEDDEQFQLDGLNVRTKLKISLGELLLGSNKEIDLLEGKKVKIEIPKLSKPGSMLRLVNKGFMDTDTGILGHLYIELELKIPEKLTDREENLIKELMTETNFIS
jgi:molecular chaperone DnaJ